MLLKIHLVNWSHHDIHCHQIPSAATISKEDTTKLSGYHFSNIIQLWTQVLYLRRNPTVPHSWGYGMENWLRAIELMVFHYYILNSLIHSFQINNHFVTLGSQYDFTPNSSLLAEICREDVPKLCSRSLITKRARPCTADGKFKHEFTHISYRDFLNFQFWRNLRDFNCDRVSPENFYKKEFNLKLTSVLLILNWTQMKLHNMSAETIMFHKFNIIK